MTKQEIYEQIVQLTAKLSSTGIAKKIYDTAKTSEAKDVESVVIIFKNENAELYQSLVDFGKKLNEIMVQGVGVFSFGEEKDEFIYDPKKIEAISLYALLLLGNIKYSYEFFHERSTCYSKFTKSIRESGYPELALFIENQCDWFLQLMNNKYYHTIYELLSDVLKGEFKPEGYEVDEVIE